MTEQSSPPDQAPALSVLDLATVAEGSEPGAALRNSVQLVQHVERLGYRRHWVAEHHNIPGIASAAPAVLAAELAARTSTIRVGSGGVMLPNHAPLVVAEQFGTLEGLHPGRIDLGIGRAPGTDPHTAAALRRSADQLSAEDFPQHLAELIAFFDDSFPPGHPYGRITATPGKGLRPEIWLLGSSDYSAQAAGVLGLPYAFAAHFSPRSLMSALEIYRSSFRKSEWLQEPHAMVALAVICAEDDERARYLAGPARLSFARLRQGRPSRFPTPEEAAGHEFSPQEEATVSAVQGSAVIGGPEKVRERLIEFAARTEADELMLTTMVHAQSDRLRSYELVAGAMELEPLAAAART
jgi:luciferase family oxidoreductase group 1